MAEDFDTSKRSTLHDVQIHEPVVEKKKANRLYLIVGIAVVVLLLGYGVYALMTSGKQATDDAQISADVVPLASRVAGQVVALHVSENQPVHRGDLIAEIDPRDAEVRVQQAESDVETAHAQAAQAVANATVLQATARGGLQTAQGAVQSSRESVGIASAAIAQARAAISHAEANAQKAANDWKRAEELGAKGDISRAQVDAARAANEAAQADVTQARARMREAENQQQAATANVQQAQGRLTGAAPVEAQVQAALAQANLARAREKTAEAALQAAQLALSYTKVYAPADGIASRLAVHAGALVAPGQAIVQLVPARTYIIANFKETQVRAMRPGQRAKISVDALGKEFEGKVESLSGGTGATFSLLPPDNASGNFVKVVQRIPVRISWNGPTADRAPVGSSADVTVYTK
jgi:membrane fusion protein (multidrug efflux system)